MTPEEKQRARRELRRAVQAGQITKPESCSRCERTGVRIEGHHYRGYEPEHALDVVWLCTRCHKGEHPENQLRAQQAGGRVVGLANVQSGSLASARQVANERRRSKTHCPQNHPYDDTNTLYYRGRRYCLACRSIRNRAGRSA